MPLSEKKRIPRQAKAHLGIACTPDKPAKIQLPGRLLDAGDLTLVGQLAEADTADAVVPQVSVGTTADLAAVVAAAGELGLSLLLQDHRLLSHKFFLLLSGRRRERRAA